jgi:Flp pilus assembly protein TadG
MARTSESRVYRFLEVIGERRRKDERGVVAVLVIISMSAFMFGAAALGVDVSRWFLEAQRVQKAADAAALGAVTYLPQDMPSAITTATTISMRNGFPNSGTSTVAAVPGSKPSQIRVTVCSTIPNAFGVILGKAKTTICRTAVADYTGPAPMGSPCNTFGNEPTSGSTSSAQPVGSAQGTPLPNCKVNPQFWATVEGPATDKGYGDRYQTVGCATFSTTDGCNAAKKNSEYDEAGYFFLVRVQPAAVGKPIDMQLFDPEFANTGMACGSLPLAGTTSTKWTTDTPNPFVTDAKTRYSPSSLNGSTTAASTCTGDFYPPSESGMMTTSFALRQQSDTLDPRKAPIQTEDGTGAPCIKQYTGYAGTPAVADLTTGSAYDTQLASVFHNWTSLCTFTPARAGDYYLQVRSNVSTTGGTAVSANSGGNPNMIFKGNPNVIAATGNQYTGAGDNSFAIRAKTPVGSEHDVSVSGYDRMPIYANATGASSTFNLIRVLPGGAGKSIAFSYYDVGDVATTGAGSVRVDVPPDATGSVTTTPFPKGGCKASGGKGTISSTANTCIAPFDAGPAGSNNTKTETIIIPIPDDYTCDYTKPEDCWYRVTVSMPTGAAVNDITTWTASVFGDPIRLIE